MKQIIFFLALSMSPILALCQPIAYCEAETPMGYRCPSWAITGTKYCATHTRTDTPPNFTPMLNAQTAIATEPSAAFVAAVEDLVQKATTMAGVDTTDPSHASLQTDLLNSLQSISSMPNAINETDLFKNSTTQQGIHGRTFVYCTANALVDYLLCLQAFPYPQYPDRHQKCTGAVIFGWSQCMGLPPIHIQTIF